MQITTKFFDEDLKVTVIDRSSQRNKSRPKIRRKVVLIAEVESDIKQEYREGMNTTIGFFTRFRLYRSTSKYYLQISGISTEANVFPIKNKIIEFVEPQELFNKICDENDKTIWWSPLTETLIDYVLESQYLTEFEKKRWYNSMIDDEE
jgi:hypothetical protein